MAQPISSERNIPAIRPPAHRARAIVSLAGAALGITLLVGTLALWFQFGTTVFFETIASGIAACF
ncbi:MAG: hypothetical protein E6G79_00105 [Alphaproteobacteria bacterium]|jgi:hypothetical protein|nr:MAG: hypothetical protein E6G79_00105 [Alphaproteobacteria bacterium]